MSQSLKAKVTASLTRSSAKNCSSEKTQESEMHRLTYKLHTVHRHRWLDKSTNSHEKQEVPQLWVCLTKVLRVTWHAIAKIFLLQSVLDIQTVCIKQTLCLFQLMERPWRSMTSTRGEALISTQIGTTIKESHPQVTCKSREKCQATRRVALPKTARVATILACTHRLNGIKYHKQPLSTNDRAVPCLKFRRQVLKDTSSCCLKRKISRLSRLLSIQIRLVSIQRRSIRSSTWSHKAVKVWTSTNELKFSSQSHLERMQHPVIWSRNSLLASQSLQLLQLRRNTKNLPQVEAIRPHQVRILLCKVCRTHSPFVSLIKCTKRQCQFLQTVIEWPSKNK